MELVEGETLADSLARGSIPVGEALPIARQLGEARIGLDEARGNGRRAVSEGQLGLLASASSRRGRWGMTSPALM